MSNNNKKDMSEDEYLRKHLESVDNQQSNSDIPFVKPVVESAKSSDLHYFNFDIKEMPCGKYYPTGTVVMVRPAQVKEIQVAAVPVKSVITKRKIVDWTAEDSDDEEPAPVETDNSAW